MTKDKYAKREHDDRNGYDGNDHDVENPKPRSPRRPREGKKSRKDRKRAKKELKEAKAKTFNIVALVCTILLIGTAVFGAYRVFFRKDTVSNNTTNSKPESSSSTNPGPDRPGALPEKISIEVLELPVPIIHGLRKGMYIYFKRVDDIQKLEVEHFHQEGSDKWRTVEGFVKGSMYVVDVDKHLDETGSFWDHKNLPHGYKNCLLFQVRDTGSLEGHHWVFGTSKLHMGGCGHGWAHGEYDQKTWEKHPSVLKEGFYAHKVEGQAGFIRSGSDLDLSAWHPYKLEKHGNVTMELKSAPLGPEPHFTFGGERKKHTHPLFNCRVEN